MASMEEIIFEGINRNTTLEMVSTEAKSKEVILEEEDVVAEAAIYTWEVMTLYMVAERTLSLMRVSTRSIEISKRTLKNWLIS